MSLAPWWTPGSSKKKRGTEEVDDAFLKEIEKWRDLLARNIALRNPKLSQHELNFAVQRTIDRIIFLRICEDRSIEDYNHLMGICNGANIYKRLCEYFYRADERYNSGLFHFQKEKGRSGYDELTPHLNIDDAALKEIIGGLYYPDSPYEFSILPASILGHVYEQFLGKVIRLTEGHRAKIEEKPEVKKAGGVYYTPEYIVDYIVDNTLVKMLDGKKPKQVEKIKILDPACGSGSFLINAYQKLIAWHRDYYEESKDKKHKALIYEAPGGEMKLVTTEKKRILLNNIFGVDIDSQAVEVTKLSLLLKVLEGETDQTINAQLKLFHDRALPDLSANIKCGNSLIGPDYYDSQQMSLLGDDERRRINTFDWNAEFPDIMKSGGFDVVVGNPPYGYMISERQQEYFSDHYVHQDYQKDFYLLFLERYDFLLRAEGSLGVIVSNTWLQSITFQNMRRYLTNNYRWARILHLPDKVFKAVVDTHVLIFEKTDAGCSRGNVDVDMRKDNQTTYSHSISLSNIPKAGEPINIVVCEEAQNIYQKITRSSIPAVEICDVFNGVKPFEKGKGSPPQTEEIMKTKPFVVKGGKPDSEWTPLLRGSLIQRYAVLWNDDYWMLYGPWLAAPRDAAIFEAPHKIMVRQTGDSIIAALASSAFIARDNLHIMLPRKKDYDLKYVLGIMNSTLMDFVYGIMNPEKGEALAQVKKRHVELLPIKPIVFSNKVGRAQHDRIVERVDQILALNKRLSNARTPHERDTLERQIAATDRQIDKVVYELYGLTDDEIRIVEESTK